MKKNSKQFQHPYFSEVQPELYIPIALFAFGVHDGKAVWGSSLFTPFIPQK